MDDIPGASPEELQRSKALNNKHTKQAQTLKIQPSHKTQILDNPEIPELPEMQDNIFDDVFNPKDPMEVIKEMLLPEAEDDNDLLDRMDGLLESLDDEQMSIIQREPEKILQIKIEVENDLNNTSKDLEMEN